MDETVDASRASLEALARELDDVRRRVDRLEARQLLSSDRVEDTTVAPAAVPGTGPTAGRVTALPTGAVAFVGRTFVVLAGAFLLRGITDAGLVPGGAGALAGLAYAAAFLFAADRAAAAARTSAAFHGIAAVLIAYPLIWETTARFALLSPPTGGLLLLVFLVLGLTVAGRRGIGAMAWANVLVAASAALGLLVRTRDLATFAIVLVLAAAAVEVLAFRDCWPALRWPAAIALDLGILALAMVVQRDGGPPEGYPGVAASTLVGIGLALAAVYVAGMAARTLGRGSPVAPFEMLQVPIAVALGCGVAASALRASGHSLASLGALALLLGAAGYAVSFSFLERRPEFGRNFYAYTALGGVLTLAGTRLLLPPTAATTAWSALAVGAAFLGARYGRSTLKVHGALYLVAAAAASGLLAHARDALVRAPAEPWRALSLAGGLALAAAVLSYVLLAPRGPATEESLSRRAGALVVATILGWSADGVVAGALAAWLAGAPGAEADAPVLGAVRTAVIAGTAVLFATLGRRRALPELTWLVYPTLAAGAVQLLVEGFSRGRPITLFVAFALYGGALVVVSRQRVGEAR
jgi:hypothetical protein